MSAALVSSTKPVIIEVYQALFFFGESMLTTPDDFLIIHVPGNTSQDSLFHQFHIHFHLIIFS